MATPKIPKNPYDKKMKNTPAAVDNFIFTELLSSKKSFYVYAGKSKKRIYQGFCRF